MRIAPIDIAHKTFGKKMMGLDPNEVIDFLRDVADQMEEVIRERNLLKESIREKDLAIVEYKERDETLKSTITTATRMAEQIRQDSEREAKLIINDSHQKAELIIKDARDSLRRIYQEIAEMKRSRIQFEANLRSLVQGQLSMLDQGAMMLQDNSQRIVAEMVPMNQQQQQGQLQNQQSSHQQQNSNSYGFVLPPQSSLNAPGINFDDSNKLTPQNSGRSTSQNQMQPQMQNGMGRSMAPSHNQQAPQQQQQQPTQQQSLQPQQTQQNGRPLNSGIR